MFEETDPSSDTRGAVSVAREKSKPPEKSKLREKFQLAYFYLPTIPCRFVSPPLTAPASRKQQNPITVKSILTWITSQTQQVFGSLTRHRKWAVLCKCCFTMDVFQVNTKPVTSSRQAVSLVQSEPKLAVQIAEAPFIVIPGAEEIYSAAVSLLKHRPSSTGCFLITEDFKFTKTIRIDFVHSTDLVARLINFGAVFINYKIIC